MGSDFRMGFIFQIHTDYAKFVQTLLDILSSEPPVLRQTFLIIAKNFTVKYAVNIMNIKVFAGHFKVLDLHSPGKVKPVRWPFLKIRRRVRQISRTLDTRVFCFNLYSHSFHI